NYPSPFLSTHSVHHSSIRGGHLSMASPPPPSSTPSPPVPSPALVPPASGPSSSASKEDIEKGTDKDDDASLPRSTGSREGFNSRPRGKRSKTISENEMFGYFRGLVKKMLNKKYATAGGYFPFKYTDIKIVLKMVKRCFESEPTMVECKVPVVIIGDLHGQFGDLSRIFDMFIEDGTPGYLNTRYVFLGDYVDRFKEIDLILSITHIHFRGRQSLEIIMMVFLLKVLHPTEFMLLRGNHECRAINKAYGFAAEMRERFLDPKRSLQIFDAFNNVFTHMPLACLVGGNILCMHGGISSKITSREDILKIKRPIKDVSEIPIATDLLWADPMIGLKGEIPNKVRGVSVYFGEDVLDQVMKNLNLKLVVRGHQMMMNGFNFYGRNQMATVFSAAAYYPDKPNRGSVMVVKNDGRIGFRVIIPLASDHPASKSKVFRGDHDVANDFDTGYVKVAPHVAAAKAAAAARKQKESKEGEGGGGAPIAPSAEIVPPGVTVEVVKKER
ncbi:hypothetical protein PFISCL1PPCAC_15107, partial [Pristionchus fissidentatus]